MDDEEINDMIEEYEDMNELIDTMKNDIQLLLIRYYGYLDDTTAENPWDNEEFKAIASKYGFNSSNLFKGFESELI